MHFFCCSFSFLYSRADSELAMADERDPQHSLKAQLDVEALGNGEYKAKNLADDNMAGVYGGQVMGQTLVAAVKYTLSFDQSFLLSSFQCYFIGMIRITSDVTYKVNRIKFSSNIAVLSVIAVQNYEICFHCWVHFQKPSVKAADLNYSIISMPVVEIPKESPERTFLHFPVFCQDVKVQEMEPKNYNFSVWIKGVETFGKSDHQNYHRIALAYVSDIWAVMTVKKNLPNFKCGFIFSLNHSMWFHQDVDAKKWHLFHGGVKLAINGKLLNSCSVFSEDGVAMASFEQEDHLTSKF